MKLIPIILLTIASIVAGLVLNILIPYPIIQTSPQPTGATIIIDYLHTSKPGYITVYTSEYGRQTDHKIGLKRIEPGKYYSFSIPIELTTPESSKNNVFITFDQDRNNNNALDESDIINTYLRHVFFTKKITRQ